MKLAANPQFHDLLANVLCNQNSGTVRTNYGCITFWHDIRFHLLSHVLSSSIANMDIFCRWLSTQKMDTDEFMEHGLDSEGDSESSGGDSEEETGGSEEETAKFRYEIIYYHQISNISCTMTKSQNLNVSRLVLQLSLSNPLKPGVMSRMKVWLILEVTRYVALVNSLVHGKCGSSNFDSILFKLIVQNSSLLTSCEIALRWKPQSLTNDKLILGQVMAWCPQATSHYLSQCWPRSMSMI